ncbi:MAG: nucleotidyltransferase family protein [Persicimonas sp.]
MGATQTSDSGGDLDDVLEVPLTRALFEATLGRAIDDLTPSEIGTALDRAGETGLFPTAYSFFITRGREEAIAERHRRRWRRHRLQQRVLAHHYRRVIEALDGLDFAILKGLPLGERLYGDARWRQTGDIDLLLTRADISRAKRRLESLGFESRNVDGGEYLVNNQTSMVEPNLGVIVELHWALALPEVPTPDTERVLSRVEVLQTSHGFEAPVLPGDLGFLQACYHFHHHVGFLKGLFDIAAWIDRSEGTDLVERATAQAARLGIEGLVQWPLRAIGRLTGSKLADATDDPSIPVRLWAALTASNAFGALGGTTPVRDASMLGFKATEALKGQAMAWRVASMTLLDSPAARVGAMLRPIFLGPDAIAHRLGKEEPDLEVWLRLLARPVELFVKQCLELWGRTRQNGS